MVKTYIKLMVVSLLALSSTVMAGSDFKSNKEVVTETCRFKNNELQLDLFGSGAFYQQGQPLWGGGAGLNYFFLKYVGLGVEQTLAGRSNGGTEWGTFGNFFLRYPICSWNIAPYALAGLGAVYSNGQKGTLAGTVGAGLEYRVTDNIGIFTDARWLYNTDNGNSGAVLARTGVRFAF
jgi:opacity protein-like surface antigen